MHSKSTLVELNPNPKNDCFCAKKNNKKIANCCLTVFKGWCSS
jgi:hypothetical protein